METRAFEKISKSLIPCPRSLLESVDCLPEFVTVVWKGEINKTGGLLKIYFNIKFTVKKGTLNIHLVNFEAFMSNISKKYSDGFKMCCNDPKNSTNFKLFKNNPVS